MRVRALLLLLTAVVVLYGCDQASSPVEQAQGEEKPKDGGETTGPDTQGNMPISGVLGEKVETPSFSFRILDVFTTDHYYYLEDPSVPLKQRAIARADSKFVVLTYSMFSTSPQPVTVNLEGRLHVRAGDKVEVYGESVQVVHPHSEDTIGGPELAPRKMLLGQFIFYVPTDVEPELVDVLYQDEMDEPRGEAGAVKLVEEDPQGPKPEEILALQYEFGNMSEWEEAYKLFARESKERVSLEQYKSYFEEGPPFTTVDYAFPSVSIEGDRATIEQVLTQQDVLGTHHEKATQEAVLEDGGWRLVMGNDLLKAASWRMNERSGQMMDSSGRTNDGTPKHVVRRGSTYVFDGSTSRVAVADNDTLDPLGNDTTLTASVMVPNAAMDDDSYDIVSKGLSGRSGGDYKMEIKRASDPTMGELRCFFRGSSGVMKIVAPRDIVDGNWHTLECMKTSDSVVARVDGQSYATTTGSVGSISNSTNVLVGAKKTSPLDDVFEGSMDFVGIDIAR